MVNRKHSGRKTMKYSTSNASTFRSLSSTLTGLTASFMKRMVGGLMATGLMLVASGPARAANNLQVLPRTTPSGVAVAPGLLGDSNPYGIQFVPPNFVNGHGMLQTN